MVFIADRGIAWNLFPAPSVGSLKLSCHFPLCSFIHTKAMPRDTFFRYSKSPVFQPLKWLQSPRVLRCPGMGTLLDKCWDVCKGCLGQSMSPVGHASRLLTDVRGILSTEVRKHFILS